MIAIWRSFSRPGIGWAVAESAAVSLASAHSKGKWAFGLPIASIPLSQNSISTPNQPMPQRGTRTPRAQRA